jgi:hypothetical protein
MPYGFVRPPGCDSDDCLEKLPEAGPNVEKVVSSLEDDATYEEVGDWLNANGVPAPAHARGGRWTGRIVKTMIYNPIYKGVRVRNRRVSKRHNRSGHYRQVLADPKDLLVRQCPHLAYIDPERYDRLIQKLDAKAARNLNGKKRKNWTRVANKKRTLWPFSLLKCSICRRPFHRGVFHGRCGCGGARLYTCWNAILIDQETLVRKLTEGILDYVEALPDFDAVFSVRLQSAIDAQVSVRDREGSRIQRLISDVSRKIARITEAIETGKSSPSLLDRLTQLEDELAELKLQQTELQKSPPPSIKAPTVSEIHRSLRTAMGELARDSQEFFRLMARIVPVLEVHLVQRPDRTRPLPRARVVLDLVSRLDLRDLPDEVVSAVRHEFWVDLFDEPLVVRLLPEVRRLRAAGVKNNDIAEQLGVPIQTLEGTIRLLLRMEARGLDTPYVPVTDPAALPKLFKRHKHRRYRFEPLPPEDAERS